MATCLVRQQGGSWSPRCVLQPRSVSYRRRAFPAVVKRFLFKHILLLAETKRHPGIQDQISVETVLNFLPETRPSGHSKNPAWQVARCQTVSHFAESCPLLHLSCPPELFVFFVCVYAVPATIAISRQMSS